MTEAIDVKALVEWRKERARWPDVPYEHSAVGDLLAAADRLATALTEAHASLESLRNSTHSFAETVRASIETARANAHAAGKREGLQDAAKVARSYADASTRSSVGTGGERGAAVAAGESIAKAILSLEAAS